MGYFNPFQGLIDKKHYPYTRYLRTSFRKKMSDTFHVFAGYGLLQVENNDSLDGGNKNHLGLFDYITFILPLGLSELAAWSSNNFLLELLIIPIAAAISFLLLIGRYVVSAAFTFALSPIVGIVHLAAQWKNAILKQKIGQLPVTEEVVVEKQVPTDTTTLNECLDRQKKSLGSLDIAVKKKGSYSREFTVLFREPGTFQEHRRQVIYYPGKVICTALINNVAKESAFDAMLQQNVGRLTREYFCLFRLPLSVNKSWRIDTDRLREKENYRKDKFAINC